MENKKLPTSWKEVTLSQFKKIVKILPDFRNEELTYIEQYKICCQIFKILDCEWVNNLEVDEFNLEVDKILFLFNLPKDLKINSIIIDGKEFGFNERIFWSVIEFTKLSEFFDGKDSEQIINNIEQLLAIFIRPIGSKIKKVEYLKDLKLFKLKRKKYELVKYVEPLNVLDIEERAKFLEKNLSSDVAYSLYFFFTIFLMELSLTTQQSLINQQLENLPNMSK